MKKELIKFMCASAIVWTVALSYAEECGDSAPLNVVLILADDLGWGDLGFNGNTFINTPCLDRMGAESAQFVNFYVHPVCAPTRASLLTGRHYLRTGVTHVHGGGDFMHPDEVTIGQWFQENGYVTGVWGKWHSGKTSGYYPWERGFDEAYMAKLYQHFDGEGLFQGEQRSSSGWTTEVLTGMTIDFIERHQNEPFFAFLSHLAPHRPLHAKEELVDKYQARGLGREMATAFAMVEMVDKSVGRIYETLEALGLADRTVLLFLSDNGPQFYGYERCTLEDYQKRNPGKLKGYKGSLWDNGSKVPLFAHCPARIPAHQVDSLVDVQDILPTLIDLCKLSVSPAGALPMDGRSVVAYLKNSGELSPKASVIFSNIGWPPLKAPMDRDGIARQEYNPVPSEDKAGLSWDTQLIGLRTEDYKLLRNPGYAEAVPASYGDEVLIDLKNDPLETTNLAAVDEVRGTRMRNQLAQWFGEIQNEKYFYSAPRFVIGPKTSGIVYLYAMQCRVGNAVNFASHSSGWDVPGDGGDYLIHVAEPGRYHIRVNVRENSVRGRMPLTLALDGQHLCSGSGRSLGAVELAFGDYLLSVRRDSGEEDAAAELVALSFELVK